MRHRLVKLFLLIVVALVPGTVHAQSPIPLAIWGLPRPHGVAFDASGYAYVAEYSPGHINVFAPDGSVVAQWGAYGPDAWSITGPGQLAMDSADHLFVVEQTYNHPEVQSALQEFAVDGTFIKNIASLWDSPPFPPGTFGQPAGVAVDATGRIFVTDTYAVRTQVFANNGTYLYGWASQGGEIALDAFGHAFEIEEGGVVRKYSLDGVEIAHWGSPGSGPGEFMSPLGIAVDATGNVYVADTENHRVQVFSNDGVFLEQWGSYGAAPGQFYRPSSIKAGPDGRIYVSDSWNNRVQIFGSLPTPAKSSTWGALKSRYR